MRLAHGNKSGFQMEPGHSRSKLDLARWARFRWKRKACWKGRTSMSKSEEVGSQWVFSLARGEGAWGGVWKIRLERRVMATSWKIDQ